MKVQKVNPLEGALNFLATLSSELSGGSKARRADALCTDLSNITIDTCLAGDTGKWETGIERTNVEGKWVIVEQYRDKESAIKGHTKWVKLMTQKPDAPLKDIDLWNLGL